MSGHGTADPVVGSIHRLTHGLLRALSCRTSARDPAVAAAWRALSDAVSCADSPTWKRESAESDERDEVRDAARAILAAVPMLGELETDANRRRHLRDTRPQSPRALRAEILRRTCGSAESAAEPKEAAKQ